MSNEKTVKVDKHVFWPALVFLLGGTIGLLINPESSLEFLGNIHHVLTHDVGALFLGSVFVGVGFLLWLSFSRFGQTVMGPEDCSPAYSNGSWFGMLFCAGIGSNLLYFGATEWTGYFLSPPPLSGAEGSSALAADWAGAYSFFHWGISAWGVYALAAVPIAYHLHVGGSNSLRLSAPCGDLFPGSYKKPVSVLIDVLFIFGLVGGIGTSLGVGIPMLSAIASDLLGVDRGMALDTWILVGLTALFSYSVSAGLDKGIKTLSDINAVLAIMLLLAIALLGPLSFIVNQAFDSLAVMFQHFIEMSLRMDGGTEKSFAAENTVFFWAWWLAWAPFMGLFIARISYGRTIRQIILGCTAGGSLACWVGFAILGNTTLHLALTGDAQATALLAAGQNGGTIDAAQFVVVLLNSLPLPTLMSWVFFVLSFIFVATSLDSAAFTLASTASANLESGQQPPRWHRLLWAFILGGAALSLMYLGGLQVLQAAAIIVGFPLMFVMIAMNVQFFKKLGRKDDH